MLSKVQQVGKKGCMNARFKMTNTALAEEVETAIPHLEKDDCSSYLDFHNPCISIHLSFTWACRLRSMKYSNTTQF